MVPLPSLLFIGKKLEALISTCYLTVADRQLRFLFLLIIPKRGLDFGPARTSKLEALITVISFREVKNDE